MLRLFSFSGEEVESSVAPEDSEEVTSLIPVCCAQKCLKSLWRGLQDPLGNKAGQWPSPKINITGPGSDLGYRSEILVGSDEEPGTGVSASEISRSGQHLLLDTLGIGERNM